MKNNLYGTRNFINGKDSLLLPVGVDIRFNEFPDYNHLLKSKDIKPFNDVTDFLLKEGFEIYLTGSVVRNFLFYGKKEYKDVDLFVKGDSQDQIKNFHKKIGLDGEVVLSKYKLNGKNYGATNWEDEMYISGFMKDRIILTPEKSLKDKLLMREPSEIDVSFDTKYPRTPTRGYV